jgi:hypothetical protein
MADHPYWVCFRYAHGSINNAPFILVRYMNVRIHVLDLTKMIRFAIWDWMIKILGFQIQGRKSILVQNCSRETILASLLQFTVINTGVNFQL